MIHFEHLMRVYTCHIQITLISLCVRSKDVFSYQTNVFVNRENVADNNSKRNTCNKSSSTFVAIKGHNIRKICLTRATCRKMNPKATVKICIKHNPLQHLLFPSVTHLGHEEPCSTDAAAPVSTKTQLYKYNASCRRRHLCINSR